MKLYKGENNHLLRGAQVFFAGIFHMKRQAPDLATRGERLAYARRLLGAVRGEDLSKEAAGKLVGSNGQTWGRWEDNEDRFRDKTLEKLVKLFRDAGLEWVTPAWLDHGYGDAPAIVLPESPPRQEGEEAAPVIRMGPPGIKKESAKKQVTVGSNPRKRQKGA
jgi:hypothetical protein